VINEVELNPTGTDTGNEWIELYNKGGSSINLGGWTARTTHGDTVTVTIPSGIALATNQYLLVKTGSQWLDNSDESVILYDRDGREIDRTPLLSDADNDDRSWQRFPNGADSDSPGDWRFRSSTPQTSNGGETVTTTQTTAQTTAVASDVTVYFIDVGQGDGIFIDTSRKDVLIDGGTRSRGEDVLNQLRQLGVVKVHIMIGTHPDADHIGGLIRVLQASDISVDTVLYTGEVKDTQTYRDFISLAVQRNYILARRGQMYSLADGVALEIVNPVQPLEFSDSNDNSIVARLTVGGVAFLFTGDCEVNCESSILNSGLTISSRVLKVGHHGSRTSTSDSFLDRVAPQVAIISAGRDNTYGHPHQETVDKLVARGITPYSTAQSGTIIVTSDGTAYTLVGSPVPIPEFPAPVVSTALLALLILGVVIWGLRVRVKAEHPN
jgi:beta-lactamase superfamily II metal-dependent hydrolase